MLDGHAPELVHKRVLVRKVLPQHVPALDAQGVVVMRELKHLKALRRNTMTYSLFSLIWVCVRCFFLNVIYLANVWVADPMESLRVLLGSLGPHVVYQIVPH